MNFTTGISIWAYEPNEFYVWNIGVDHKPNTADDLAPVFVNAPEVVFTREGDDYGDVTPKISNRYIVWTSRDINNHYNVNLIDMGLDGVLDPIEASNPQVIYTVPYNLMRINSLNLKGSKISFTYHDFQGSSQIPPEVGFCDLNINSGTGSCSQNDVIIFSPSVYDSSKMIGDAYFYVDPNLGTQVLFNERIYLDPQIGSSGPIAYQVSLWSQNSGINLISNQTNLVDLYESLAVVSYRNLLYGYFHPGNIPGSLIPISSGLRDINPKVNVRNDFSPSGNYLVAYTKNRGSSSNLYLGSLGNGLELQTPFRGTYIPFLDSSRSGNYLYISSFSAGQNYNYNLYYTQCFGI